MRRIAYMWDKIITPEKMVKLTCVLTVADPRGETRRAPPLGQNSFIFLQNRRYSAHEWVTLMTYHSCTNLGTACWLFRWPSARHPASLTNRSLSFKDFISCFSTCKIFNILHAWVHLVPTEVNLGSQFWLTYLIQFSFWPILPKYSPWKRVSTPIKSVNVFDIISIDNCRKSQKSYPWPWSSSSS